MNNGWERGRWEWKYGVGCRVVEFRLGRGLVKLEGWRVNKGGVGEEWFFWG